METILNYLDNMFAPYPQTEQVRDLKNELMMNMEDKYKALMAEGKTSNEAVGKVIAEFGNIEELMQSVGVEKLRVQKGARVAETVTSAETASDDEVLSFVEDTKLASGKIAAGALLCIISPALLLYMLIQLNLVGIVLGAAAMFALSGVAVWMFVSGSRQVAPYQAGKRYPKQISARMQEILAAGQESFRQTFTLWLCLGIGLCAFSPLPLILMAITTGTQVAVGQGLALLLLMVGVGVYMLIRVGYIKNGYNKLLRKGEYQRPQRSEQSGAAKSLPAISGSLATCIFLFLGFAFHAWGIAWIIFPLTGAINGALKRANDQKDHDEA